MAPTDEPHVNRIQRERESVAWAVGFQAGKRVDEQRVVYWRQLAIVGWGMQVFTSVWLLWH